MFETTDSATQPVTVQLSAWQCFKAGAAFTAGAIVFATTIGAVWTLFVGRFWSSVMLEAMKQLAARQ